MKVCEIFKAIQGEGRHIGTPFQFLRLSGCNLACPWCDTKYSWDKDDAKEYSVEDVAKRLYDPAWPLCITGGEPLLQKTEISSLLDLLGDTYTMIETNGTIVPFTSLERRVNYWCVSPKFGNINKLVLEEFDRFPQDKVEFKWVVADKYEWRLVRDWRSQLHGSFTVQPRGTGNLLIDIALLRRLIEWQKLDNVLDLRVLPQMHRLVYGNVRGV